jgi:hypothetical protein
VFVLDDRNLRDLANFIKGPIRQFGSALTDRQPTVRIIDEVTRLPSPPWLARLAAE